MQVVRDLIGGGKPMPIEMFYNGDLAADSTTLRYKGSLVKLMDFDDVDHGGFATFGLLATAMENVIGILEEEHGTSGNYLPDDATYGMQVRKITPCFPSTVVMAEYARSGPDGTALTDTGATCSAASKTFTIDSDTADEWIGGWVYMLTGSAAGELHYITDSAANTSATFATAAIKAIASADTFLAIGKANCREVLFDAATGTCLTSTIEYDLHVNRVVGIMHYLEAPGIPFQRLDRNKHDGLVIPNARFYHTFTLSALNAWANGYVAA
jgi:hypothetical protein